MGGGGGWAEPPRCQKSGGGGEEAVASVEPGRPPEAAQVSGFRGAGNNSLLSREMYICSCEGELLPAFLIPLKTCKIEGNHERMWEGPPPPQEGGTRRRMET
jgi:hypothetical protein